ncbi:MAG: orotidine-5'-phosphate decarboxylase [Desulfovibrionaceae bacterium]|nr:orotidine-5'-phosphate decarboxylase [Desulfovibrionaceae bacterium]
MKKTIPLAQRIIVALDVPDAQTAICLAERLGEKVDFYKVGLELFLAAGFAVPDRLAAMGRKIMLDLKFHDIPETVKRAVARLADHDIALFTAHAAPGVIGAAAQTKGRAGLLAVTVLTSHDPGETRSMMSGGEVLGVGSPEPGEDWVANLVLTRARDALKSGADGVVCSGREAALVRRELGGEFLIVVPGIRPTGHAPDDQRRAVTAAEAIRAGADHLVVGRPITRAADPLAAAEALLAEIAIAGGCVFEEAGATGK